MNGKELLTHTHIHSSLITLGLAAMRMDQTGVYMGSLVVAVCIHADWGPDTTRHTTGSISVYTMTTVEWQTSLRDEHRKISPHPLVKR